MKILPYGKRVGLLFADGTSFIRETEDSIEMKGDIRTVFPDLFFGEHFNSCTVVGTITSRYLLYFNREDLMEI